MAQNLSSVVASLPNLGPGSNDAASTRVLQQALVAAGYMTQAQMNTGPGIYGPQTTAAVANWQAANGIPTSGNPGYFGPVSKNYVKTGANQDPNAAIINPTLPKSDYTGAPITDTGEIPGLPASMQNLAVYNLPQEAFQALVPQLVPGTPEYQAAMDKISTAYFDVMQQQMNASTEQEQIAAQSNWSQLKSYIERNLNVSLSNDAIQAWDQIQALGSQYAGNNIADSGLQAESIDDYLTKIRATDSAARSESQTKQESAQQDYYQKFATPQQVAAFIAANPQKAKDYGLLPSDAIKNAMTPAALKAKYPTMSDADIQSTIASVLDENGNYRSALYQKYMTGSNVGISNGNIDSANIVYDQYGNPIVMPVKPSDTGMLDIQAAKERYQALNTPLASQSADYAARVKLGSTPPTTGATSASAAGTQFNKITPSTNNTPPSSNPTPTLSNPITVPGSMTSSGTQTKPTTTTTTPTPAPKVTTPTPAPVSSSGSYTIQYGDTLSAIAKKLGTTTAKLAASNGIADPNKIQAGKSLKY